MDFRPVIDVSHVSFEFQGAGRKIEALRDMSLSVGVGEIVAIVGPSGCGKTTLLRLIAGLLTPAAGTISIGGPRNDSVGFVFQDYALLPWRTVDENIVLPLEVAGQTSRRTLTAAAERLTTLVGIDGFRDSFPYELSGGMRQRVALARALVSDPAVLLMDEPFSALDHATGQEMAELLLTVHQTRKPSPATIVVTHNVTDAVFLADRVVILTPRPGAIRAVIAIENTRPRGAAFRSTEVFKQLCNLVFSALEGLG